MSGDHERYGQDVGAYLLGALPPLEAEVFERHLMGCDECRDELVHLRPAAEALPRSVDQYEPPSSLKASLMEVVEADAATRTAPAHEPQAAAASIPHAREKAAGSGGWLGRAFGGLRLRPALALGFTALVLGAALGLGLAAGGGEEDAREISATVDRTRLPGGSAQLEIAAAEGEPATLRVTGVPLARRGEVYEVWIERDGEVRPAGALFDVSADGRGSAAIPGGVEDVDRVMVTRERAGGVTRPTETPVIVAEV